MNYYVIFMHSCYKFQEILDRNIFILKSKILLNKSDREIADRCNLCRTSVQTLYKKMLKDLKHIIQK
jgi:hypothetical protein